MLKFTYFIITYGKFSTFIWKTWKSQGILKFIFCDNSVQEFRYFSFRFSGKIPKKFQTGG